MMAKKKCIGSEPITKMECFISVFKKGIMNTTVPLAIRI